MNSLLNPHSYQTEFLLDPSVTFLNHGSFGATPRPVFEAYQRWQLELEREPVQFLGNRANALLAKARSDLGAYLGTSGDNLVYVTNATYGANVVAHSLKLHPGDEVLATNHEYGAIDRTWHFLSSKYGFTYRNIPIRVPITTAEEWLTQFWAAVTPHTKLISISHITSPTGLIFPIQALCSLARQAGILTLIDGAHAPGQIPLNLDQLDADFYTGNLHKWLCAPKGSAFLYTRPSLQSLIQPLVVSWGYESTNPGPSTFIDYLEMTGTRDISAFLAASDAIQYQHDHDWASVQCSCHALLSNCMQRLTALTGLAPLSPDSTEWYSQLASIPLPPSADLTALHTFLWEKHHIEVPVISWNGQKFVRVSIQAYNTPQDIDHLISALTTFFCF
jgi:isopenicillin-N epimerase